MSGMQCGRRILIGDQQAVGGILTCQMVPQRQMILFWEGGPLHSIMEVVAQSQRKDGINKMSDDLLYPIQKDQ
jgi:hypothetical protein